MAAAATRLPAVQGLCGLAATLTGVGIGRFAYVAILPLLVQQGWFSQGAAGQLGAANLAGYFLGIFLSAELSRRWPPGRLVQAAMLVCALSLAACGWRGGGLAWFLFWRTAAGCCGAVLMIQAPVLILPRTAPGCRGRVSGLIFSGVGLGIVVAAALVPGLARHGLALTWLALGGACLLLTALTWRHWQGTAPAPAPAPARRLALAWPRLPAPVALLLLAYTLNAIGYLPHTLFWGAYLTGELQRPLAETGFYWACFGIGAAAGPCLTGVIADRIGLAPTLFVAFCLKAFGVALPLLAHGAPALLLSSVLVGFFSPGIVGAVSSYALEVGGAEHHGRHWTAMNFGFSLAQAGGASLMASLMGTRQSYALLFSISSVALAVSAACIVAIEMLRQGQRARRAGA